MKTKTLSLELSKRLNDLCLLDNIETEYCFSSYKGENDFILLEGYKYGTIDEDGDEYEQYKTLTEFEIIEFLKEKIQYINIEIEKRNQFWNIYTISISHFGRRFNITGNDLIKVIEQVFEYLLDKNLLTK